MHAMTATTSLLGLALIATLAGLGPRGSEVTADGATADVKVPVASTTMAVESEVKLTPVRASAPSPVHKRHDAAYPHAQSEERQTQLENEVQRLAKALERMTARMDRIDAGQIEHELPTFDDVDTEMLDMDFEDHVANVENVLLDERVDMRWADTAQMSLEVSLEPVLDNHNAELVNTDCRSSMCRIESMVHDLQSIEAFADSAMSVVEWDHSGMVEVVDNGDGSSTVVLFISRDGFELPQPEF